jgi:AcrR family transcriptional regulator
MLRPPMPKLWTDSIDAHRRAVRAATLDSTARLVARHGLRGVTMAQIAEHAGIGRATLYKYYPDVEAILVAWHERHVANHLAELERARDEARDDSVRLAAVLEAYALIAHEHPSGELAAALHRREHVAHARAHVQHLVTDLIRADVDARRVRADVPPAELAGYCLSALEAARGLRSKAAVRRLVGVVLDGVAAPRR